MSIHAAIADPWAGLLTWLRREPVRKLPEPQHDLIASLRAEFQSGLANERTERALLGQQLTTTQAELAQARDHGRNQARTIALMESTVGSLQRGLEHSTAELISLTTALAVANERTETLRQESQQIQAVNAAARQKLNERVAQLETIVEQLTSENAGNANRAQIAEAQNAWYAEENAMLRSSLHAAGGDLKQIDERMAERGRRVLK
jgi:chromosome segregation ATPase